MTARILMRGTTRHSRAAIDRQLDELKARMGIARSGPQSVDLVLSTQRDRLASALALAVEVLREPAFPASEFELLRREALTRLEQSQAQPEQQAARAMQRQLSPFAAGHVRYVRTFDEQRAALVAISVSDLKRFHADFYGGSHASIAVVGDFDAAAVEAELRRLLGGWKAAAPYAPIVLERLPAERHDARIDTPDKANALVLGGLPVMASQDDADFPALELFAYMFGGNDMRSRLGDRIRQKDGLSYSAGASLDLPAPLDRVHLLTLYAITAPANAPRVEQAFREELARAQRDGFSEQEVVEARGGYLKESQLQRSEDRSLAGMLVDDATLGRTMKWTADFESRVAALTAAQVNEVVRRRVSAEALSIVTAGDLAKGAQPAK
jgi:zinc protease